MRIRSSSLLVGARKREALLAGPAQLA
jgi:hypothetical protein